MHVLLMRRFWNNHWIDVMQMPIHPSLVDDMVRLIQWRTTTWHLRPDTTPQHGDFVLQQYDDTHDLPIWMQAYQADGAPTVLRLIGARDEQIPYFLSDRFCQRWLDGDDDRNARILHALARDPKVIPAA